MGLERDNIQFFYRDRPVPARKPIMVPRWISVICLVAVGVYSVLFLLDTL